MNKKYLLAMLFCSLLHFSWAQRTITGKVTDAESGEALPGAAVVEKGSSNGAVTDFDGNYSITVSEGDVILEVSYIGYVNQEAQLSGRAVVNFILEPASEGLDEVVVIGYGTTTVKDATGAVSSIQAEDFNQGFIASPEQLIQGRSAGVQITSSSGEPGAGINIRIRGTSSVRTGNNPLFVVDGIPLSGDNVSPGGDGSFGGSSARNPLNFLNPNDIKDISILKDASATAIYGSRGANGVVIITTKSGRGVSQGLEYSATMGISRITKKYEVLDAKRFLEGVEILGGDADAVNGGARTDWQDEILRTGVSQNHNISYSNSNDQGNYRASISYFKQDGIVKESSLERTTLRINGNRNYFDDRLKLTTQATISNVNDKSVPIGDAPNHFGDLLSATLYLNPTLPVYLPDGSLNQPGFEQLNPVAMLRYNKDETNTLRALVSLSAEYKFTEELSFKTTYGYDASRSERKFAYSPLLNAQNILDIGSAGVNSVNVENSLWDNFINYEKDFGNVRFTGLLGYSYQSYNTTISYVNGRNFRTDDLGLMINNLASAEAIVGNTSSQKDELQSFFSRLNFSIKDKFLATATIRADGSTRFGGDNKYGYFPSLALAYRLSDENFIPESISNLKVRFGWGITGNQEIPHQLYVQRQRYGTASIQNDGTVVLGSLGNVTFANPGLKWETTDQLNAGIDFGFAQNRIRGSVDVYKKTTTDLLIQVISAQPAPQPYFWRNLNADIINSGVELSLAADLITTDKFSWTATSNLAYNKNVVKNFEGIIPTGALDGQGLTGVTVQQIANNQPMYAYYLRIFEGFDENGKSTYKVDAPEFTGDSALPKYTMGFTNTFTYKNLDMNIYFNGQFGHKIYSNTGNTFFYAGSLANGRNVTKDVLSSGEAGTNVAEPSTRFLESGSFVRLQNLSLGYNVPVENINGISRLRLSLTGQNLLVFTDYSGQDPEVNVNKVSGGVPSLGIDYTAYPRARTIMLGLNVKF